MEEKEKAEMVQEMKELGEKFKKGRDILEQQGIEMVHITLFYSLWCVPDRIGKEEALQLINEHAPSGTSGNWGFAEEPKYAPIACHDKPDHTHYVLAAMCNGLNS